MIAVLIGYATFCLLCELTGMPSRKASKTMLSAGFQHLDRHVIWDVYVTSICRLFIKLFRIQIPEKKKLSLALEITNKSIEQEVYLLRPIFLFILVFVGLSPMGCIHILFLLPAFLLAAVTGIYSYCHVFLLANRHRSVIISELPQFVECAAQYAEFKSDLQEFLRLYYPIAGKAWKEELELILINEDMLEASWQHMRERIDSPAFQEIYSAMLNIDRNSYVFLKSYSFQCNQKKQKEFRNRLNKNIILSKLFFFILLLFSLGYGAIYIKVLLL